MSEEGGGKCDKGDNSISERELVPEVVPEVTTVTYQTYHIHNLGRNQMRKVESLEDEWRKYI
jgi:hypothetical protein